MRCFELDWKYWTSNTDHSRRKEKVAGSADATCKRKLCPRFFALYISADRISSILRNITPTNTSLKSRRRCSNLVQPLNQTGNVKKPIYDFSELRTLRCGIFSLPLRNLTSLRTQHPELLISEPLRWLISGLLSLAAATLERLLDFDGSSLALL